MVLVDTSVWIDFLRCGNGLLEELLRDFQVSTHPLVIGELAVGNLTGRDEFLSLMKNLPGTKEASHDEVRSFIDQHQVYGKGVGYFDVHILCSAILANHPLWTLDKRLHALAQDHNIAMLAD